MKRFDHIRQDTRYALRTLRKKPAFAATAIVTLALAIGGNTAMFSVVRAVLLKPLAYRDPDRLVNIADGTPARFVEMRAAAHAFTDLGAHTSQENVTLSGGSEPEVLKGVRISASFLRILSVSPVLGRGFRTEEDAAGGSPVAMISYDLWQRRFAGDPQIVGKTVVLSATPSIIIGVLPPHFQFPFPALDVWMTAPSEWPLMPPASRALSPFLHIFGRVKPGVNFSAANAEMKVIYAQYVAAHPAMLDAKSKEPGQITPMKEKLVANVRSILWMLFGAVGFVLLIACANVASLLLARAVSRSREFAVRAALGAPRSRLIGQLLAESILLSSAGGVMGILLASWSLRVISSITSFDLPRAADVHLDWTVLAFAGLVSTATGLLFGLAPSFGASRPDLMRVLRTSGETAHQGGANRRLSVWSTRSLLSVAQIALSIVLLIGVTLLVESIGQLRGVNVGFNPANLLTMRVSLPPARYDTDQKKTVFFQDLLRRIEVLPGVRSATAALTLPMMGYPGTPVQDAAKPPLKLNERPIAKIFPITPGFFRTLVIPLRRGRDLSEHDTESSQRVVVINESLARHFWPGYPEGSNPVGQRLLIGGVNPKPAEIVGIVADVHQSLVGASWPDSVYVPFGQGPYASSMLAIRTAGDPLSFTKAIREQVLAMDRDQPIAAVQTMDTMVDEEIGQRRLLVILLGSFATVALLLALIGIYGVIAYSVAQRTQELGIRRALGAQWGDILRLVMGQGFVLAVAGIAAGLAGAFAVTSVLKTLLFQISPTDPATFAGVAVMFLVIALAASYIPARRATRIDPMAALRMP